MGRTRNERRKRRLRMAIGLGIVAAAFWVLGIISAEALSMAVV